MTLGKVLIVEDDRALREALCDTLELAGFTVHQADSGEAALKILQRQRVNMVVTDVNMAGMTGHELLAQLQQIHPSLPVLLITAYGDVGSAVSAMRSGAVDYLVKPFKPQELVVAVCRYVSGECSSDDHERPVAEDIQSQQLLALAEKVAATDSTVLISGESGTGKEVLAGFIHTHSTRSSRPFVAINCAAIPENMLEATLFGHEKGAFTGAYSSHAGKFEQANGGTLLLDEISEMDLGLQAKLLRVLQEREVERVGGKKVISLDVRVIATTNRDLHRCVQEGLFREDLYYRLSVFPLQWSALRERRADIEPLAKRLIAHHARKMKKTQVSLHPLALEKLLGYDWPGNVRELDNVIQRALIMQQGEQITLHDLMLTPMPGAGVCHSAVASDGQGGITDPGGLGEDLKHREYQLIIEALKGVNGRKNRAAEKLGISARTLRYKLAKMRESGYNLDVANYS